MTREDLSHYLIHWVSGSTLQDAFNTLLSIISHKKIYGSNNKVKGSYCCVCFTETPKEIFKFVTTRYLPYGIRISKRYAFKMGARPVIYQKNSEYYDLPENLRWRHVRYEPDHETPIDFTWEREWRILANEFALDAFEIDIIVPNRQAAIELEQQFSDVEYQHYQLECMSYGQLLVCELEPLIYSIKLL